MNFKIILPLILIVLFGVSEFFQIKMMKEILKCETLIFKILLLITTITINQFLSVLMGLVQALVFSLLTCIYFMEAAEVEGEELPVV